MPPLPSILAILPGRDSGDERLDKIALAVEQHVRRLGNDADRVQLALQLLWRSAWCSIHGGRRFVVESGATAHSAFRGFQRNVLG
jgi:hypothetical protein